MNTIIKTVKINLLLLTLLTTASGQSLEPISQPKGGRLVDMLRVGDVLVVAQWNTGAVISSTDGGQTFQSTTFSEGRKTESLAAYKGNVYVSVQDAGVFVSSDQGRSFSGPIFYEKHRKYYDLAVSGGKLFVSTGHGLFQFDGTTWSENAGLKTIKKNLRYNTRVNAGSDSNLAVAIGSELWISNDGGVKWVPVANPAQEQINCFLFDKDKLLVGSFNDGIWTVDLKTKATAITSLRDSFKRKMINIRSILVSGNTWVAGAQGRGCWVSKDGGVTWAEAKDGKRTVRRPVHSLIQWNNTILAGLGTNIYRVNP